MTNRRKFLKQSALAASAMTVPLAWSPGLNARDRLPARPIPGSDDTLPIVGLGNSNAFRSGDLEATAALLRIFHENGGAYIDCMGESRFVVAEALSRLGAANDMFLGSYFMTDGEAGMRDNARRLLDMTGKKMLDLVHAYPEFAVPNWDMFRHWKDEGLTKYIGVARHQSSYYETMMKLIDTGSVDFLQVNYSPLETEADERILPMAMERGVAVNINRPFLNGELFSLVAGHELPDWAAEFDCASWAQFSLKFILSHPAVNCVLTETANPKHALDNIGAGFGRMPDEKTRQRIKRYLQDL